jgi:hypothetical protein
MVRPLLRMLALAVVLLLAGSPVLAAVCDATCATAARATVASGESTPRPHHHAADSDVVGQAPADSASDAAAHAHHHHAAAVARPGESRLVSSTSQDDCRRDGEIGALPVVPRIDAGIGSDQLTVGSTPALPAACAELPGAHLLRHGPSPAPAFLTAPLVLRI